MRIHRLPLAIGIIIGVYLVFIGFFDYALQEPIPVSVMKMYMFFIVVGVLLAFTADEESANEMAAPVISLIFDVKFRKARHVVFAILPMAGMALAWWITKPTMEAPVELRTVHPAPPATLKAFGKTYDLISLENPYRKFEKNDPGKFRELVNEGKDVFFKNCFFCHGDKLDGKGHYAVGFSNPLPANFVDVGTIAQLQESFLFWRIATGGPGLPNEGAPWASPMPVWKNYLNEDEIWKVILFLYDYTGNTPRVMKADGE